MVVLQKKLVLACSLSRSDHLQISFVQGIEGMFVKQWQGPRHLALTLDIT